MNDAFLVRRIERVRHLNSKLDRSIHRKGTDRQRSVEAFTFEQFHRDERLLFEFLDRVDRADSRMIQRRSCSCLAQKARQRRRILCRSQRQKLQRHQAAQLRILGLIHHTHTAAAQLADDPVMRDRLSVTNLHAQISQALFACVPAHVERLYSIPNQSDRQSHNAIRPIPHRQSHPLREVDQFV
jgi:hypothetical protein